MTQEMMQGIQLREPQSIMNLRDLERLSSEIVRLCDSVENHGLVDYQMGVSEEDIMDCEYKFLAAETFSNYRYSAYTMYEPVEP